MVLKALFLQTPSFDGGTGRAIQVVEEIMFDDDTFNDSSNLQRVETIARGTGGLGMTSSCNQKPTYRPGVDFLRFPLVNEA